METLLLSCLEHSVDGWKQIGPCQICVTDLKRACCWDRDKVNFPGCLSEKCHFSVRIFERYMANTYPGYYGACNNLCSPSLLPLALIDSGPPKGRNLRHSDTGNDSSVCHLISKPSLPWQGAPSNLRSVWFDAMAHGAQLHLFSFSVGLVLVHLLLFFFLSHSWLTNP